MLIDNYVRDERVKISATDNQNGYLSAKLVAVGGGNLSFTTLNPGFNESQQINLSSTPSFTQVSISNSPTVSGHTATKGYVDDKIKGLDWQKSVLDMINFVTSEPSSPIVGSRYINTATGLSSVTSQSVIANYIYEWNGTNWTETSVNEGFACWVEDVNTNYVYNGTAWVGFGTAVAHNDLSGLDGGTPSQYYHLTNNEYTVKLPQWDGAYAKRIDTWNAPLNYSAQVASFLYDSMIHEILSNKLSTKGLYSNGIDSFEDGNYTTYPVWTKSGVGTATVTTGIPAHSGTYGVSCVDPVTMTVPVGSGSNTIFSVWLYSPSLSPQISIGLYNADETIYGRIAFQNSPWFYTPLSGQQIALGLSADKWYKIKFTHTSNSGTVVMEIYDSDGITNLGGITGNCGGPLQAHHFTISSVGRNFYMDDVKFAEDNYAMKEDISYTIDGSNCDLKHVHDLLTSDFVTNTTAVRNTGFEDGSTTDAYYWTEAGGAQRQAAAARSGSWGMFVPNGGSVISDFNLPTGAYITNIKVICYRRAVSGTSGGGMDFQRPDGVWENYTTSTGDTSWNQDSRTVTGPYKALRWRGATGSGAYIDDFTFRGAVTLPNTLTYSTDSSYNVLLANNFGDLSITSVGKLTANAVGDMTLNATGNVIIKPAGLVVDLSSTYGTYLKLPYNGMIDFIATGGSKEMKIERTGVSVLQFNVVGSSSSGPDTNGYNFVADPSHRWKGTISVSTLPIKNTEYIYFTGGSGNYEENNFAIAPDEDASTLGFRNLNSSYWYMFNKTSELVVGNYRFMNTDNFDDSIRDPKWTDQPGNGTITESGSLNLTTTATCGFPNGPITWYAWSNGDFDMRIKGPYNDQPTAGSYGLIIWLDNNNYAIIGHRSGNWYFSTYCYKKVSGSGTTIFQTDNYGPKDYLRIKKTGNTYTFQASASNNYGGSGYSLSEAIQSSLGFVPIKVGIFFEGSASETRSFDNFCFYEKLPQSSTLTLSDNGIDQTLTSNLGKLNIVSASDINLKPSGDVDDYLSFYTASDIPWMKVNGGDTIGVTSDHNDNVGFAVGESPSYYLGFGWRKTTASSPNTFAYMTSTHKFYFEPQYIVNTPIGTLTQKGVFNNNGSTSDVVSWALGSTSSSGAPSNGLCGYSYGADSASGSYGIPLIAVRMGNSGTSLNNYGTLFACQTIDHDITTVRTSFAVTSNVVSNTGNVATLSAGDMTSGNLLYFQNNATVKAIYVADSTLTCTNLNSDLLDGQHGSYYGQADRLISTTSTLILTDYDTTYTRILAPIVSQTRTDQKITGNKGCLELDSGYTHIKVGDLLFYENNNIKIGHCIDSVVEAQIDSVLIDGLQIHSNEGVALFVTSATDTPSFDFFNINYDPTGTSIAFTNPLSYISRVTTSGKISAAYDNTGIIALWTRKDFNDDEYPSMTIFTDSSNTTYIQEIYGANLSNSGSNGLTHYYNTAIRPAISVANSTVTCPNLNADLLDGQHGSYYGQADRLISTTSTLILSDDITNQTLTGNLGILKIKSTGDLWLAPDNSTNQRIRIESLTLASGPFSGWVMPLIHGDAYNGAVTLTDFGYILQRSFIIVPDVSGMMNSDDPELIFLEDSTKNAGAWIQYQNTNSVNGGPREKDGSFHIRTYDGVIKIKPNDPAGTGNRYFSFDEDGVNCSLTVSTGLSIISSKKTVFNQGANYASINLTPFSGPPTTSVAEGDLYADSSTHKIYFRSNAAWIDLTDTGSGSVPSSSVQYSILVGDGITGWAEDTLFNVNSGSITACVNISNTGYMDMTGGAGLWFRPPQMTTAQRNTMIGGWGAGDQGKSWFNSTTKQFEGWNGTAVVILG